MKSSQRFLFKRLFFAESLCVLQISKFLSDRINFLGQRGKYPSRGPTGSSPLSSSLHGASDGNIFKI